MPAIDPYQARISEALKALAVPESFLNTYRLPRQDEAENLVPIGLDMFEREQRMEPQAAVQWREMVAAAKREDVTLLVISVFRSFDYQRKIIERKLAGGQTLAQITRASALPGYSEHHTGRQIDVGTSGSETLTEAYEHTPAFAWLSRRAGEFGFFMTYPRDNAYGIMYEPWHWMFHGAEV